MMSHGTSKNENFQDVLRKMIIHIASDAVTRLTIDSSKDLSKKIIHW